MVPAAAAPAKKSAAHIARDAKAADAAKAAHAHAAAWRNSSEPVGKPQRDAASDVQRPLPEKKDAKESAFRELSPAAAKAEHVYKAAASARSKAFKRKDEPSDESASLISHDGVSDAAIDGYFLGDHGSWGIGCACVRGEMWSPADAARSSCCTSR